MDDGRPGDRDDHWHSDEEAARRRDEVIRVMLGTKPKPRRASKQGAGAKRRKAPRGLENQGKTAI